MSALIFFRGDSMQGQKGNFMGGNNEKRNTKPKKKRKRKRSHLGVEHGIYVVAKECFDSSLVSSPRFLRCEDVASKLPRGPPPSLIRFTSQASPKLPLPQDTFYLVTVMPPS